MLARKRSGEDSLTRVLKSSRVRVNDWVVAHILTKAGSGPIGDRIPTTEPAQLRVINAVPLLLTDGPLSRASLAPWVSRGFLHVAPATPTPLISFARRVREAVVMSKIYG